MLGANRERVNGERSMVGATRTIRSSNGSCKDRVVET